MCWNCIISVCNSHVQDSQLHTCNTRTHNYIAHSCTRVLLIAARTLLTAAHVYWLTAAHVHCSQLQYSQLHTCNTHSCTRAILTATLLTAAQVQCLQLQTCIAHSCPYIAHILLIRAILTAAHDTRAILTAAHVQYSQLHTCNAHSCTIMCIATTPNRTMHHSQHAPNYTPHISRSIKQHLSRSIKQHRPTHRAVSAYALQRCCRTWGPIRVGTSG